MLYTQKEPERPELQASVGNGYIGTTIGSNSLYIGGVFNRVYWYPEIDHSRRSRMPTTTRITIDQAISFASALDLQRGVYYRRSYIRVGLESESESESESDISATGSSSCLVLTEQRWYAHRKKWSLIMHELEVDTSHCRRGGGSGNFVNITITEDDGGPTDDVFFRKVGEYGPQNYEIFEGTTVRTEIDGGTLIKVAYARWNSQKLTSLQVPLGVSSTVFYFPTVYRTSLDTSPQTPQCLGPFSDENNCGSVGITQDTCVKAGCCYQPKTGRCFFNVDVKEAALSDLRAAMGRPEKLLSTHMEEWAQMLEAGIELEGDLELAKIVNASYYYILSSIREGWPYSVSPGGLFTGGGNASYYPGEEQMGYFGHTFWDADMFVMPSLLAFYPSLAEAILDYRFQRINESRIVAESYGNKGTKFAWESALTGAEENVHPNDEDHLTPDIAIASRQFYRAVGDDQWLRRVGLPLLTGISDYLVSRVVPVAGPPPRGGYTLNQLTESSSNNLPLNKDQINILKSNAVQINNKRNNNNNNNYYYSILEVQPPNEYADHVNNSVYTNVAASLALKWTLEVASILNYTFPKTVQESYLNVSTNLYFPFDEKFQMHLGYQNEPYGYPIKQADVSLLGFPLQYEMPNEIRRNDIIYEVKYTDINGPAMTHALFSINWLELGESELANSEFIEGYDLYVRPPFNVWLECPDPGCKVVIVKGGPVLIVPPCPNFITGAGGFLQALIYGYLGLRYNNNNFTINPILPKNSNNNNTNSNNNNNTITAFTARQLFYLGNTFNIRFDNISTQITWTHAASPAVLVVDSRRRVTFLKPGVTTAFPPGLLEVAADGRVIQQIYRKLKLGEPL
jgi:hypothetical protein